MASFEEDLKALESVVERLERGDLSLEIRWSYSKKG